MSRTIFAFFAMIILLSSACVIAVVDSTSRGQYWPKSTFRKNLDLNPGGAVSVENSNGNIEISGWKDERIEISAEASRESPKSAGIYFFGRQFSPPDIRVRSTGNSVRIGTGETGYEDQ